MLALLAAVFWGGGDFSGGMAVKAAGSSVRGALRVIISAHLISLAALTLATLLVHDALPRNAPVCWGLFAGFTAGLSLAAFYVALARGVMGTAAAVSGLIAAAIPAAIGVAIEGKPGNMRLVGFLLAALAIWLIASSCTGKADAGSGQRGTLLLAIVGGVGFGVYFAALKFANPLGTLMPLLLARIGSTLASFVLLLLVRRRGSTAQSTKDLSWLTGAGWLWAVGVAVLDTGGNLFYIAATRAGRLDIAAVLASLYPATTILLAAGLLRERPGRRQLAGMALAVVAVILVSL